MDGTSGKPFLRASFESSVSAEFALALALELHLTFAFLLLLDSDPWDEEAAESKDSQQDLGQALDPFWQMHDPRWEAAGQKGYLLVPKGGLELLQ